MKRLIYFVILVLSIMLVSCKEEKIVPENIISADREYMVLNYGEDYRWFETTVHYLNEGGTAESVESIFQVVDWSSDSTSADVKVIRIIHTLDNDSIRVTDEALLGYSSMNEMKIAITYEDAFNIANCIKPYPRYCILRRPLGNDYAIYIFENEEQSIFINAETGEIDEGE